MSAIRILGIVDILSALMILFNVYNIHWIITNGHFLIMLIKGTLSLIDGPAGIIMGAADIITAFFILFAITGLLPLKIILFVILIYKGAISLV